MDGRITKEYVKGLQCMRHCILILCFLLLHGNALAGNDLWYEMSLPWNKGVPFPIDMSSRVLDAPAGKHGHVQVDGDRLQFSDGTPVRFWGVVMAVSGNEIDGSLPPAKKDASVVAKKIASYGFNHVRIIGFDGHAPQALNQWKKTGKVNSKQIDRLDYFINELRKLGIYYSLSINNNSVALFKGANVIKKNDGEKMPFKQYRNTRLFDDAANDYMVSWIKAFYSRKNPYTGLTYANDPANIYVAAINEDTANIVRFNKGRTLNGEWVDHINDLFNHYLHEKYQNSANIEKSWSGNNVPKLLPGESFKDYSISLFTRVPHMLLPDSRVSDMHEFLINRDINLTQKVQDALRSIGYKGLITGTNKWYGLANLYSDYMTGDYIDGHDYFGGVSDIKRENKELINMSLQNKDYLRLMADDIDAVLDDSRFALHRILPAHLIDRPYFSSEWNHMAWSDHAHQGPFIISSYASLNGIDGLNVHKLYNHPRPSYKDEYPRNPLVVAPNPLLASIMPTLSLAYLRGYIEEYKDKAVYCYASNKSELEKKWHLKPEVPNGLKEMYKENPFGSVRVALLDGCKNDVDKKHLKVSHESVRMNMSKSGGVSLDIDTSKYVATVGELTIGTRLGPMKVMLDQPGSVSLISLDDKPLLESECSLLTVAGPTKNTNMGISYKNTKKILNGIGEWPPLLRGNTGTISVQLSEEKKYKLIPVSTSGVIDDLDVKFNEGEMLLTLDGQTTPWYLITSNGCDG